MIVTDLLEAMSLTPADFQRLDVREYLAACARSAVRGFCRALGVRA